MRETNEFFDEQAKQCRAYAKRASNKSDRDFWLCLAQRWEELLRIREHEAADAQPVRKYSSDVRDLRKGMLLSELSAPALAVVSAQKKK